MVILRSQNKITDFFMILPWLVPLTVLFSQKSATIQCARRAGDALSKSNARAHLKQRKKHSGLTPDI